MKCPHCHEELPARECPQCSEKIPLLGEFCCYCGAAFADDDSAEPDVSSSPEPDEDGIDFSSRTLCSDGSCIGVINEHGICNECGKSYSGEEE